MNLSKTILTYKQH